MEPDKIPLSTLSKMEKGAIPMTEEGKQQIAKFSERMGAVLPNAAALQLWSQHQTNALAMMQRTMVSIKPLIETNFLARPIIADLQKINAPLLDKVNASLLASPLINVSSFAANFPRLPIIDIGGISEFRKVLDSMKPFSEHLKIVLKRQAEVKATSVEVYRREKKLYYKEYGLNMPHEHFWDWFVRKNDDTPIWEVFDSVTYESMANDYGQYIAEIRYKRIRNHSIHFEMISDANVTVSPSHQQSMMHESEYLTTKEFREGSNVKYYSELVNQRFGQTYKGTTFYSGLALAVIENSCLEVQQRLDDENNPHQFKFIDTVIDGNNYLNAYKEGFKAGIDFFEKEYLSTSSVIYGSYADAYAINLHKLYKHGPDNVGIGWEWEARGHNRFITDTAFRKYGYYAGLCYSIDCLAQKHPHLSDTIYTCIDEDNSKASNRKVIPNTLFDAWIEDLDSNGRKPYYDEVIMALVEHDRLKEIKGELYWITSDNYVSYCAGFIWTCIDKGWVKMYSAPKLRAIINNSFNTTISSTTTFKQDALFSLGAKYSNPFKSMRKNAN